MPALIRQVGTEPGWSAVLSADLLYRFRLARPVPDGLPSAAGVLVSCGINPSTADAFENDSTVRKELGYAARWNLAEYVKVNAYPWRALHPRDMWRANRNGSDIHGGPFGNAVVRAALTDMRDSPHGGIALAAWGGHVKPERAIQLYEMAQEVNVEWTCLGTNQDGSPCHPLYLPYATELVRWSPP